MDRDIDLDRIELVENWIDISNLPTKLVNELSGTGQIKRIDDRVIFKRDVENLKYVEQGGS